MRIIDLTGQVFSRLTVVCRASNGKRGDTCWVCECRCGNEKIVSVSHLKAGRVKSCGCYRLEYIKQASTIHGMRNTSEYNIWTSMKQRCVRTSHKSYKNYGGRGIKVCKRWQSFENFYADMGERPRGMTIERIDNDGDYEPENCKWATLEQQANNKRNNRLLTFEGETLSIAQWARKANISYPALWGRIKRGWSTPDAIGRAVH